jgi:hypothetical protein
MSRLNRINTQYAAVLAAASHRFAGHEDMSRNRILQWLGQFADHHLQLGARVLQWITYYDAQEIRSLARQLLTAAWNAFPGVTHNRIVFVPVGEPGSGSAIIARAMRDVRPRPNLLSMADLEKLDPADVSVIVFVDDFSGTGTQLFEWWQNVESLVRPKNAEIAIGLLVLNGRAKPRLAKFAAHTLRAVELNDSSDVFHAANQNSSASDKTALLYYCRRTRCHPQFHRGYGNCGLLIAFRHGCPNNSLPILWYRGPGWRPLFRRSAI